MKKLIHVSALCALTLLSFEASAYRYNFRAANAAFDARENNRNNIADARRIYTDAVVDVGVDAEDRFFAAERLGRLALYEATYLEKNRGKRLDIFADCLTAIETIKEILIERGPGLQARRSPQYYYWNAVCLGQIAKNTAAINLAGRLERGKAFKKAIDTALERAAEVQAIAEYEGGGVFRVAAGAYRKKAANIIKMYNIEQAHDHVNVALGLGPDHLSGVLIKAKILMALKQRGEVIELIQSAVERYDDMLDDGQVPQGLELETKLVVDKLKEIRRTLK